MKTNIAKLDVAVWYGFIVLAASMMVLPICLPEISASLKISFTKSGALENFKTILGLVVIFLAGIWAGRWGKKPFLTLGQYILAAGLFITSFASSYVMLMITVICTGIGSGLSEAMLNPLVPDLHPVDTGKHLNLSNAFFSIGVVICSLLFGELLTLGVSWRWIFRYAACAALAAGLFFNSQRFPAAETRKQSSRESLTAILKQPLFWLFAAAIFLGGGAESAFTFWSRSYVKVYLDDVPRSGAAAVALFAGAMAAGRLLSARLSRKIGLEAIMLSSSLLGMIVSFFVPFARDLVLLYVLLGFAGLATACLWPSILAEAGHSIKVHTTLLMTLLACAGAVGFGLAALVMGIIGDIAGLQNSFYIIPVLFLLLILLLLAARFTGRKKLPVKE